jgi:predicted ATPase
MARIKRIALTGGPSGGKSTTIRRIQQTMPDVLCAPEVATLLLSGGYPAPSAEFPWGYGWQKNFQRAVAAAQVAIESEYDRRADLVQAKAIVYDRGILDGASYLRGGIHELEDITQISEADMLARYDAVIHLPSSAAKGLEKYDKASNQHRFEEAAEALALEGRVLTAWDNHPNRIIVDGIDPLTALTRALQQQ